MIFLFLFLGNFSMGANTYSHHCILYNNIIIIHVAYTNML